LFPACGDDGMAVGSALFVAHNILNERRNKYKDSEVCYLGTTHKDPQDLDYKYIAKKISEGKIVALINGKSEYGPRALGNRSILADPRNFHNREILNFVIKKREWFRPFAPSVLEEKCSEWFDFDKPSPFMLFTAKVKNPKEVPAISHVDNTARMQTVNEETNADFYRIIKEFYEITNIPMILNTSLNGFGEPILETEKDGQKFFENVPVDIAVFNGKIKER
jgi:carbamoyltransferase